MVFLGHISILADVLKFKESKPSDVCEIQEKEALTLIAQATAICDKMWTWQLHFLVSQILRSERYQVLCTKIAGREIWPKDACPAVYKCVSVCYVFTILWAHELTSHSQGNRMHRQAFICWASRRTQTSDSAPAKTNMERTEIVFNNWLIHLLFHW